MIYMEWLEALGAVACYKFPNPYIPLHLKLEQVMPRHTTSCHIIPCHAPYIPLHLKLEQVMPRHTTSCHIIPCHAPYIPLHLKLEQVVVVVAPLLLVLLASR